MQETFLYVLRKFPGFELTARFKTFLYPVVKHTALEIRERRRRSRGVGPDALPGVEEIAVATDTPAGTVKSRLHHAVAKMRDSPRFRDFFQKD